ncbi:hypothetical protein GCM10009536_51940 [Streptomyces thermocarboxydus]|uniref:Amino acid permease n=1 Tax=Streptomyces thermodiastaticus TaxID=44061 RepID=A0ABU0KMN7_9ACTN|nr:amino acid permease [Streptomyces thermodiastaticus]
MATPREDAAGSPGGGQEPALRRVIGPRLLVLFVVGDVLGTGIYATTGEVAGKVGGACGCRSSSGSPSPS